MRARNRRGGGGGVGVHYKIAPDARKVVWDPSEQVLSGTVPRQD